jgi:hypothetical protein
MRRETMSPYYTANAYLLWVSTLESLERSGEVVGYQESLHMCLELVVGAVVIALVLLARFDFSLSIIYT